MSTEQETSGVDRTALDKAFNVWHDEDNSWPPPFRAGWLASRDYYKAQFLEQNGKLGAAAAAIQCERDEAETRIKDLTHRLDIALEHKVACAEQRQRADMAEERERGLREKIARAAAALVYLAPALDALGVALLHGDPLAELRVRFSDLIPEIEKAVGILSDADVS